MDSDRPRRTWTDPDRQGMMQTDQDWAEQTQGSHGFQTVLPDFETNFVKVTELARLLFIIFGKSNERLRL